MTTIDALEELTQRYGRGLFERLDTSRPLLFTPRWWDELLMSLTLDREALKVQLFRFIDVLPALRRDEAICARLAEYLGQAREQLPGPLRWLLRWLPRRGWPARVLAAAARLNADRMARRFIAGANLAEALAAIARMRQAALGFTIDLLGEAVLTEAEASHYQHTYLDLIDGLAHEVNRWPELPLIDRDHAGPLPRVNVSLKLSSLYSQFDPIDPGGAGTAVKNRLRPILRRARQRGAFVNIDMEQFAFKDLTLKIFQDILMEPEFRDWPDAGIAIQAYLRSCSEDLAQLRRWVERRGTPVWVRLVKGAYWDYETVVAAQNGWPVPVFMQKWQSDANFEAQTRFLFEHHTHLRPALGSHNIRNLAHALSLAEELGLPPRSFEFQMLYGMADPIKTALVSLGQRVRVYTPYGELLPGMAYLVRRLLENTANQSFLRASFFEHVNEEQLLMNPTAHPPANGQAQAAATPLLAGGITPFRNEPHTDFSRPEARADMHQALADVGSRFDAVYPLVIDGRAVATSTLCHAVNPSHKHQTVGRWHAASREHAEQAVAAARAAFPAWRDTPADERVALLFRAAAVMRRRRFELAAWEVHECGKPWREADADVAEAIDFCEYYAREMLRLAVPRRCDVPGEDNEYFYEPRGVAVVIAPWNFPLAILCGMTAAAIVTGNTAIMKPAEQSAVVGAKLMEVLLAAGCPPGVVNFLPGRGEEIGPLLVQHPDVALIAFTGSQGVGLEINQSASMTPPGQDHVKKVIAEMGGKNAILIDEDADLDEAIGGVITSAFGYSGQKCSACSRVIVPTAIHDLFLQRLVEAARSLRIAPAEDPACSVGPVIDADAHARILAAIQQGRRQARQVYPLPADSVVSGAGGVGALAEEGFYIAPHIFADVPPSSSLAQDEIFGPVLAVLRARDLTEALQIANGTRYALTGGVYSRSPANLARVRREFRVGNLYLNRGITGALVQRHPFGGFKLSGIGSKAGGPDYLLQFVVPRAVSENTLRHGFAPNVSSAAAAAPADRQPGNLQHSPSMQ